MNKALADALAALDGMLRREILRLRSRYQLSLDEFRGLYVSDEQVDDLVRQGSPGDEISPVDPDAIATERENLFAASSRHHRLCHVREHLNLTALETVLALLAALPVLEPKYENVFAYLNNDVARRGLTTDLAVRLLSVTPAEVLAVRAALAPAGLLVGSGLVSLHPPRDAAPGASPHTVATVHRGFVDYLIGLPFRDEKLAAVLEIRPPAALYMPVTELPAIRELAERIRCAVLSNPSRVCVLEASTSLNASSAAYALCAGWDRTLVTFDLRSVPRDSLLDGIARAILTAQMTDSVLLVEGLDLIETDGRLGADAYCLRGLLRGRRVPVLIALPSPNVTGLPFAPQEYVTLTLPALPGDTRRSLWAAALERAGIQVGAGDLDYVASNFVIGPEAVTAAAQALADDSGNRDRSTVTRLELLAAARAQSDKGLGRAAARMAQRHVWEDLVLPPATRSRVRTLIESLKARQRVLEEWGLARTLGATGLRALLAGASGTGKTMTVAIIARELGLDAYRVDLSQTVSKYIGETEKNLEKIFQAAERAQAILFFDEADALLGKRSEVKDAHDRYANIEVAYLLQRLEEFSGIVIVASNVSQNIDLAFARRMQFVIDFPLPGPTERTQLWRQMLPPSVPRSDDIDYDFLGRRFELAGGDIRNVVLDAAFAAASREEKVGMRHIAPALARELVKQGRSPSAADFRHHFASVEVLEVAT